MTHKAPTVTATDSEKDPLKFWGDALAVLGKSAEALTYAPKCEQLISARHVGEAR